MSTKFPNRNPDRGWTRRGLLLAGGCASLLAGCSSDPNSDSSALWDLAGQTFGNWTGSGQITRDQAAAIPYATIGVRVGDSNQTILALESKIQGVMLWTSSARIALETQSGRIIRTSGLERDASQSLAGGSDPLQRANGSSRCDYAIDMPDRGIFQAPVRYDFRTTGSEKTEILGATMTLRHAVEHGSCPMLNWEFDNEYWLGDSLVWRSRQALRPDVDPIEVTILRPAAP